MWKLQTEGFKAGMLTKKAWNLGNLGEELKRPLLQGVFPDEISRAAALTGLLGLGAGGLGMKYYMGDKAKQDEAPMETQQEQLTPEQEEYVNQLMAAYAQQGY